MIRLPRRTAVDPGKLRTNTIRWIFPRPKGRGAEEGITYHDSDNRNSGSGTFNGKGTYLKEFRMAESPDISYTNSNNPEPH